ncbi:MAG: histidinol-phosphate transaminase [Pseudomonadota bacterium]
MGEAGLTPKAWFDEIAAYQGGESALPGVDRVLKLSSNENPLGPSSRAVEAYRRAADKLAVYPEGSARILREAVAAANGIDPDRIVCGAGSDELISLLCQVLCGPGDEVIHTEHAFAMYRIAAQATGATPVAVPETDITADPRAILKAVTPRTKIVFLANPNNPTGTYLPRQALTELVEDLPRSVLLVIDGAYAEYMRRPDYEAGFALAERAGNVAVTRTFSKIYGLAALRLGWVYAPAPLVEALNKARGPFNVSGPALAAGEAAVKDADYVQTCAIQNEVWRDWMIKELRDMGVSTPEGFANFVLPEFGAHGPASAAAVDGYLRAQGVIVRRLEGYGLPGHLRITVGSAADNVAVVQALRDFVEGGGGAMSRGGGAEPYS